jgi:Gpi18-like mannosyltransferase
MREPGKTDAKSTLVGILTQPAGVAVRNYGLAFLWVVLGVAVTIVIRVNLLDYRGGDVNAFVSWCDDIEKKGFAKALIGGDCNYSPAYIYVLWLATKLPFDRAFVIKAFSILCDYVCATALALVVFRVWQSKLRALLAAFSLLIAPTVVFNGALWGQCDMVYAAPLAVALAAVLGRRYYIAAALFGVAISIKLQAVFLFPLLGIWAIRRELPLRALLLVPATYLGTLVPAWLAGCSWADLLMIYAKQAQQYSGLTLNAPTIFVLLADEEKWIGPLGLWFAIATVFMVFLACVYARVQTTATVLVRETIVFASLAPFLLPHMHERYLFLADVMSVVYAFVFPARFWIAICVVGASLAGYSSFLFNKTPVPLTVAAAMMGVSTVVLAADLLRHHYPRAFAAQADKNEQTGAVDSRALSYLPPDSSGPRMVIFTKSS